MTRQEAEAILVRQRRERQAGKRHWSEREDNEFVEAAGVVLQARRKTAPAQRTPTQILTQLRRVFGDERSNSRLWARFPKELQRSWATAKKAAGETLTGDQAAALQTVEGVRRGTWQA